MPSRLLASAACVLIEHLRHVGLNAIELQCAQVSTIRLQLFEIAARVVLSVRRVVLHLSSSYPHRPLFRRVADRLTRRLVPT